MGLVKKGLRLIAIISFCVNSASAEVLLDPPPNRPDFESVVEGVLDSGLIVFEKNAQYRLWGVIPDVPYLRKLIGGRKLRCMQAGRTFDAYTNKYSDACCSGVHVVYCHQGLPSPYPEGGLAEHLLATGHAIEICPETGNRYGTCGK